MVDITNNSLQSLFWLGAAHGAEVHAVTVIHEAYVLCGDNQYRKEYGVQPEQILAALTGFYRGNQYIDCEKNKKYKQYVKLWCSPLFPRRCAVWAVKAVMKIRSRASKR